MMSSKPLYSVFVDGNFAGITDDEDEIWSIAEKSVQGSDILLDDDVDRVQSFKIKVNIHFNKKELNQNQEL